MSGTLTELAVAGKLLTKTVGRRLRGEVEAAPDLDAFAASMQKLLDGAPSGVIESYCWFDLPANEAPWLACDMSLSAGDEVSYFFEGRVYANRFLDIWVPLALQIWSKVGDGDLFRGTRKSHSFTARDSGPLQFGNYFPNDWADPAGTRQQSDSVYASMQGGTRILVVRWTGGVLESLRALQQAGDYEQRLQSEIDRIEAGDLTPEGWYHLWHVGPSEIYRDGHGEEGSPCIHCHTAGSTGILQKDVDVPLQENSEISWRWCVKQLPSPLREDAVPSHDYLSIAVEFDNGKDITYYWSSTLPVGTGYDCPLPNWKGKEFHVVIRSGEQGLGEWHTERRNLYSDYLHYMGEPPGRIVRVWLIANSLFQRNSGSCDYSDIVLRQDSGAVQVL
tara:strand:+ start:44512 stop:45681 length:1170 start_codon:yes stop_codon:yes gene_type:complete